MHLLKQSTAATVKAGPFLDDTDGVTEEVSLTIAQADIRISKNGGAFAQTNNATGATHDENGYYGVPLDTTDTNTLGRLRVAIHATGALPVWHEMMVLPANAFDALVGGTDTLQTHATEIDNDLITAAAIATGAIDADAIAADAITAAKVADATIDAATFAAGAINAAAIATDAITAAKIAADAIGASEIADGAIDAATFAAGAIDAAAIATGAVDADALAADAVAEILTTQMTEAYATDGTAPTLAQALFMIWSMLAEKAISGTTLTAKKLDGSTTSMTFTLNDASNPTSITRAT